MNLWGIFNPNQENQFKLSNVLLSIAVVLTIAYLAKWIFGLHPDWDRVAIATNGTEVKSFIGQINLEINDYHRDHGKFPRSVDEMVDGGYVDLSSSISGKWKFNFEFNDEMIVIIEAVSRNLAGNTVSVVRYNRLTKFFTEGKSGIDYMSETWE